MRCDLHDLVGTLLEPVAKRRLQEVRVQHDRRSRMDLYRDLVDLHLHGGEGGESLHRFTHRPDQHRDVLARDACRFHQLQTGSHRHREALDQVALAIVERAHRHRAQCPVRDEHQRVDLLAD